MLVILLLTKLSQLFIRGNMRNCLRGLKDSSETELIPTRAIPYLATIAVGGILLAHCFLCPLTNTAGLGCLLRCRLGEICVPDYDLK